MGTAAVAAKDAVVTAALEYAARGWPVFPCKADKTPYTGHGYKDATTDPATIEYWWTRWPGAAIGLDCGRAGLCVIDCDVKNGTNGIQNFNALGIDTSDALLSRTPSGGRHILFSDPTGTIRNSASKLAPGVDVRAVGGYILLPPSAVATGEYQQLGEWDRQPGELPDELRQLLTPAPSVAPRRAAPSPNIPLTPNPTKWLNEALRRAVPGQRNEQGFWLACQLRDDGHSEAEAETVLREYAARVPVGSDPYTAQEALASLRAAYGRSARNPARGAGKTQGTAPPHNTASAQPGAASQSSSASPPAPPPLALSDVERLTDTGNARRLIHYHGKHLLYCPTWASWLVWDGSKWARDETSAVGRLAIDTASRIGGEAAGLQDPNAIKAINSWAGQSVSAYRLGAMVKVATSLVENVKPDSLDGDGWILNVSNGVVDLKTGDLQPHDPSNRVTKQAPVDFDPAASCDQWLTFLDRIMAGDWTLIDWLQRAVGYSLTGDVSEQCFFVLWGSGANGKSTFAQVIGELMGDYAQAGNAEMLLASKYGNSASCDVAKLRGARMVTASEVGAGRAMAEALVKQLTGGDVISARLLYSNPFEFKPVMKLWLLTNHKPRISGTDNAIWRRVRLVPFTVTIPEPEQDKRLAEKLRAELPGILAWAVRGCLAWQKSGLQAPAAVVNATAAYRAESDLIGQFLEECTEAGVMFQVMAQELYDAYKTWCTNNGEHAVTGTAFGRAMTERGIDRVRTKAGNVYKQIKLV